MTPEQIQAELMALRPELNRVKVTQDDIDLARFNREHNPDAVLDELKKTYTMLTGLCFTLNSDNLQAVKDEIRKHLSPAPGEKYEAEIKQFINQAYLAKVEKIKAKQAQKHSTNGVKQ